MAVLYFEQSTRIKLSQNRRCIFYKFHRIYSFNYFDKEMFEYDVT